MRFVAVISPLFFLSLLLLAQSGCESAHVDTQLPTKPDNGLNELSAYTHYAPVKADIMPLTEFVVSREAEGDSKIRVYVALLDSFGSQVKSPAVFRFELYEYAHHSTQPRGKRIIIWPDMDLTVPPENNRHWRDFLRAYEFNLHFEPESGHSYILQATCLCPDGRRLSAGFDLKYTQ